VNLMVPARCEIIIEGHRASEETPLRRTVRRVAALLL
jgi:hypothetical protein